MKNDSFNVSINICTNDPERIDMWNHFFSKWSTHLIKDSTFVTLLRIVKRDDPIMMATWRKISCKWSLTSILIFKINLIIFVVLWPGLMWLSIKSQHHTIHVHCNSGYAHLFLKLLVNYDTLFLKWRPQDLAQATAYMYITNLRSIL